MANGIVYVGSKDHKLYALNAATGKMLWSYTTRGSVDPSPAVVNGMVFEGSLDHNIYAFHLAPALRRPLDDLIGQLGGNVTQSGDDGLACKAQRALSVPTLLAQAHQFSCRIGGLSQIRQKVFDSSGHRFYGLGANVIVPRLEGAPRDDVDSDAQEFLKVLEQADVIKKRSAWLEVHKQV